MSPRRMTDDVFPFEYVGGGHFRRAGVPKGEPAETLHGEQVAEFVRAALTALEAENKALREALEEYGQHGPACMAGLWEPRPNGMEPWVRRGPCDCGLDEARAALQSKKEGA